jgi:23S rRNA G2069 N7-methylase RlmK/C1962 C5-methylase RlmI
MRIITHCDDQCAARGRGANSSYFQAACFQRPYKWKRAARGRLARAEGNRVASRIKPRRPTRPEAIPFQRGRVSRPAAPRPPQWIDPATWRSFAAQKTDAHRVATGSDLWMERFGADLLLSYQNDPGRDLALAQVDERCAAYGFKPARIFGKFLPHQAEQRGAPALLRGDAAAGLETETMEGGVRYGLDFAAGYSAGFFIDQRENRAHLRRLAPKRLLNTFAYTCSFSVVAAFQVQRDFEKLAALALDVAAPHAQVLLSVNHSAMRAVDLEQIARGVLRMRARTGKFSRTPVLPDFPPGAGASSVWLELGN